MLVEAGRVVGPLIVISEEVGWMDGGADLDGALIAELGFPGAGGQIDKVGNRVGDVAETLPWYHSKALHL